MFKAVGIFAKGFFAKSPLTDKIVVLAVLDFATFGFSIQIELKQFAQRRLRQAR